MRKVKRFIGVFAIIFAVMVSSVNAMTVTYTELDVPADINTSFKTYMDYRTITSAGSPQYRFIHTWGWQDCDGFMRCNAERDLGIPEDYYLVALGSYYGTAIGTKYRITTDTGNVFYAALGDQKANHDTNSTHQYSYNNDIVEFLVDTRYLTNVVKVMGSANTYMPLNGRIEKIERIDFIE